MGLLTEWVNEPPVTSTLTLENRSVDYSVVSSLISLSSINLFQSLSNLYQNLLTAHLTDAMIIATNHPATIKLSSLPKKQAATNKHLIDYSYVLVSSVVSLPLTHNQLTCDKGKVCQLERLSDNINQPIAEECHILSHSKYLQPALAHSHRTP